MRLSHSLLIVSSLVICAATALGDADARVPVLVGAPVDLDGGVTTNVGGVSVAYNSVDREYRVFWFDSRIAGENDVYAQRVGPLGALLGANVAIAVGPASRTATACAYDPRNNDYLVSYQFQGGNPGSPGFNHSYGGIISAAGSFVGTETDLSNGGLEGTIAYSGNEFFLEARNFAGGGAAGIRGQRISLAGAPIGAGVTIASAGAPAPAGQVGYNPSSNCYLATWRDQVASDLKGQVINPDGSFGAGPFVISSIFPGSALAASVAGRPNGEFLVVFGDFSGGPIYGQFVGCDGSLPVNFEVVNSTDHLDPYVAYDPHNGVFLVAYHDYDTGDLFAVLITPTTISTPLRLATGTTVGSARVAANADLGGFVVTWVDSSNSPTRFDVLAQIVGVTTNLVGDVNCDGAVNFDDINPFVQLLSDPAGWQASFPYCPAANGDCNGDQHVNFEDINPFVALLSGR